MLNKNRKSVEDNNAPAYFKPSPPPHVFPSRKQLGKDSAKAIGYILTTSRSSADDYFVLSCDRGGQYLNFKNVPEERTRKVEQRRLDVWLAIRDSTGKIFGNFTFATIILLMRIFWDILKQGT